VIASFILSINMFTAGIFAVAFGVVAATNRTARGAAWLAAGYAFGIVDVLLEFVLPWQSSPAPVAIGIFLVFLTVLTLCLIGVASHYGAAPPSRAMTAVWIVSLLAIPVIFTLSPGSPMRGLLYQLPYVVMQGLIGWIIWRSMRRQPLDLLLMALNGIAACSYLLKPAIAWTLGAARTPQDYMATTYAAISQSIGSVTLVALGLVLLLVMMRDTTAEMVTRSETDSLSGVLNRRGFDAHGERMLGQAQRSGSQLALVMADLDHFKAVNDNFGHAAGDEVIANFAARLRDIVGRDAVVSRLGGEEFAVLLCGANLADGRRFAEQVRETLLAEPLARLSVDLPVTASFGVAQAGPGDSLFDLSRRADAALYRAKSSGRNRVNLALSGLAGPADPVPLSGSVR